jgi:hypothetical protein
VVPDTSSYEIVDDNSIGDQWGMAGRDGTSYPRAYRTKPVSALLQKALTPPALGGAGERV